MRCWCGFLYKRSKRKRRSKDRFSDPRVVNFISLSHIPLSRLRLQITRCYRFFGWYLQVVFITVFNGTVSKTLHRAVRGYIQLRIGRHTHCRTTSPAKPLFDVQACPRAKSVATESRPVEVRQNNNPIAGPSLNITDLHGKY